MKEFKILKSKTIISLIFCAFMLGRPFVSLAQPSGESPCPCDRQAPSFHLKAGGKGAAGYLKEEGYDCYHRAQKDWKGKRWDNALEKYRSIINNHPQSYWAAKSHLAIGLYLKYNKHWDEAINKFRRGINLIPGSRSAQDAETSIACIHTFRGNYENAEHILKEILAETKDWDQVKYCSYWLKEIHRRQDRERDFPRISCGPKALSTFLKIKGITASPKEIENLFSSKNTTVSMQDLKKAAQAKGVKTEGVKGIGLEQLSEVELPIIALVRPGHYIVVSAIDKDGYRIIDPFIRGGAPYKIKDKKLLENVWTGYLLVTAKQSSPPSPNIRLTEKEMSEIKGGVCYCCPENDLGGEEENPNTEYDDPDFCGIGGGQSPGMPSIMVNTVNLNLLVQDVDLSFGSIGPEVVIKRTYNADDSRESAFGRSWTFNYNLYLIENPGGQVDVIKAEGATHQYTPYGDGNYDLPWGIYDILTKHADGSFSLQIKKDKTIQWFDPNGMLQQISDQNGNSLLFEYNPDNQLISITDATGRLTFLTYNANGKITAITDPLGRQAIYSYDEQGNLISTTDMAGNTVTYSYDENSYLTSITTAKGTTIITHTTSDEGCAVESITYPTGNTYTYGTDETHYQVKVTDPEGGVTLYSNNYEGFTECITDPIGNITQYLYDVLGNLEEIIYPNNHTTQFQYDSYGNITKIIDPLGHTYSYTYDDRNNPTSRTNPLGRVYTYTYDSQNNLTAIVDPQNNQTNLNYNSLGLLITMTNALGYITTFTYDSQGNLISVKNPLNHITTYTHDALGRILSTTDANGNSTSYTYDGIDRIIKITYSDGTYEDFNYSCCGLESSSDRNGFTTNYVRDDDNRLIGLLDALNHHTVYQYDKVGNRIAVIDAESQKTFYKYDLAGRLTMEGKGDGDSNPSTLFFDDLENGQSNWTPDPPWDLTESSFNSSTHSYTDSPGGEYENNADTSLYLNIVLDFSQNHAITLSYWTTYEIETDYDYGYVEISTDGGTNWAVVDTATGVQSEWIERKVNLNQYVGFTQIQIRFRLVADNSYTYDGWYIDDVKISAYDLEEEDIIYNYDAIGNLTRKTDDQFGSISYEYNQNNQVIGIDYPDDPNVSFAYDQVGNLGNMADNTGTSIFEYNELDKLIGFTDSFGNQVSYGYDAAGNRTSIIYPDSKTVTYVVNSINKLEKIIDWLGNEITYVWDPVGNLSEIIYPNGITAAMSYDSSNRLISVEHTDNYEATICSHQYTLDDVGNRTAVSMNQPLAPTPLITALTYSYEFMNKLTSVNETTTFTYDNHGNTISKVSSDITSTYSYDDADRLIQRQIDEDITQYCYNGLGHRISKQVGTQTTRYILDINSPLSWVMAETDESNQITAYYVYGSEVGLVSKITPAGQVYYYHYDGAGNTVCMTDSSGNIVNKYAYDEFGILLDSVETTPNPFRYAGKYGVMDEGNGLLFMRARYYDPETGRFLSTDPVNLAYLQIKLKKEKNDRFLGQLKFTFKASNSFSNYNINLLNYYPNYSIEDFLKNPQILNLYLYVQNNPINLKDPSGLLKMCTRVYFSNYFICFNINNTNFFDYMGIYKINNAKCKFICYFLDYEWEKYYQDLHDYCT